MAADNGTTFPFTAVTVVLLFLSTSFLGPRAFELWRQVDADASKRLQLSQPPVEAHLWEDPLSALDRYRQKQKQACTSSSRSNGATSPDPACQPVKADTAGTFRERFSGLGSSLTLIAAMLPGANLVGAEEARRRVRYAVLAGLNAEGYVPDDSEHMGLLQARYCGSFSSACSDQKSTPANPSAGMNDIIYESLRTDEATQRRAVVLWIDDTKSGRRWLSALAVLLKELSPAPKDPSAGTEVRLRVLGPYGSDALFNALTQDLALLPGEARADKEKFDANWKVLQKLQLISPQATASGAQLIKAARVTPDCTQGRGCVSGAVADLFGKIRDALKETRPTAEPAFFLRTIGTDDLLIKRILDELAGRGIDLCSEEKKGRVVLIAEWDSIYARIFGDSLKQALKCAEPREGERSKIELKTYSYLRGLDGVTLDDPATQAKRDGGSGGAGKSAPIEWPEGRAQEDYVRRLVQEMLKDNDKRPIQAIGMIGWDVHDKLILVQALRDAFPDRTLFTTDMDARLLHPSMTRYTRNIIVASSLPLTWSDDPASDDAASDNSAKCPALPATQNQVGPFRDSYQTATYLAARLAFATDDNAKALLCRINKAVAKPVLFEVGRDRMVMLKDKGVYASEHRKRVILALVGGTMLLALGALMLVGYPAPGMQAAACWWSADAQKASQPLARGKAFVAGIEMAALGYAAAVIGELASPGSAGAWGPPLLAAVAAVLFWAFVYPGTRWAQALRPAIAPVHGGPSLGWRWARAGLQFFLLVSPAVALWWFVLAHSAESDMREPFAPLSGVSAWPSLLFRTLIVVLFAWFLDSTWFRSSSAVRQIEKDYFRSTSGAVASTSPGHGPRRWLAGFRDATVWLWQPRVELPGGRIDGAQLWREYRKLMDGRPRCWRLLFWLVLSSLLVILTFVMVNRLTEGADPEIPARGLMDRALIGNTQLLSALCVVILLVLVGDVTILTWRFVAMLKRGRTVYPPETIERFATELGPEMHEQATQLVAAYPNQRGKAWEGGEAPPCRNSLLDDWIDAWLLAEHTAQVGPLIVYPFVLIALTVVARSRLFDNWQIGGAVLIILVGYVLWSLAMAGLLNYGAERARRKALEGMRADLLWLKGAGRDFDKLADRFPSLIEQVSTLRKGAFAPFFEQPLVQAILVPLGGAGGIQLLDLLLYARPQ
jgi:hypothetical protein